MEEKSLSQKKSTSVYDQVKEAEKEKATITTKIQKQSKDVYKAILYYSLPLISILVFFAIMGWGTVKTVREGILGRIDEIEEKEEEIDDLDDDIARLKEIQSQEARIDADLAIIDKIVPEGQTQVAKFITEIEEIALQNNLEKAKYTSGENIEEIEEAISETEEETTLGIIDIPTESEYVASFNDIKNFLNALYSKNDFIIVKSLELQGHRARELLATRQREEGVQVTVDTSLGIVDWTMLVTFEKYQFSSNFSEYIEENLVDLDDEPDQDILDFIRRRFG
jgi:hypothetical protein